MAPTGTAQRGSIECFLQKVPRREEKVYKHQEQLVSTSFLWPTHSCQQILAAELGWPASRSLRAWQEVHARQRVSLLRLPSLHDSVGLVKQQEVSLLQLQQQDNSSDASQGLAAVGYHNGMLHLVRVHQLLSAAEQGNSSPPASTSDAAAQVCPQPRMSAIPADCVWTVSTGDKLISCCWAPPGGGFAEMVTAGTQGVHVRRFVEGRHHEYRLNYKPNAQPAKFRQVRYLDKDAAYTVAALRHGELILWDCRAASRAVSHLTTSQTAQLLRTLPGGQLVLTATAEGEMALYDVRRVSNSSSSSVINFGGSRKPQQLIASYNVPARADEAAVAAAGHDDTNITSQSLEGAVRSSSSVTAGQQYRIHPFFRDVQLNPADCNLVAYVRPDLQVGVFDLYQNKVLQQVCVAEAVSTAAGLAAVQVDRAGEAPARCCWDPQGKILFTHGLLKHCTSADNVAVRLQPTIAAVDFGSWRYRRMRQESSRHWMHSQQEPTITSEHDTVQLSTGQQQQPNTEVDGDSRSAAPGCCVGGFMAGGGLMCQEGQVQHLPLGSLAVPTELAVCHHGGQLLLGTLHGNLLCIQ